MGANLADSERVFHNDFWPPELLCNAARGTVGWDKRRTIRATSAPVTGRNSQNTVSAAVKPAAPAHHETPPNDRWGGANPSHEPPRNTALDDLSGSRPFVAQPVCLSHRTRSAPIFAPSKSRGGPTAGTKVSFLCATHRRQLSSIAAPAETARCKKIDFRKPPRRNNRMRAT